MATKTRDRVTAWFFAIIFIVSTLALSVAVIIANIQQSNNQDNGAASQQATTQTKQGENMLAGTKLENFTPVSDVPTIQSTDLQVGNGQEVKAGDTITFDYTGALAADGTIFQSSKDSGQAVTFSLNDLIKGWQEGIPGMKAGGIRRLLIPSELGYGANAQQGIPANSDLVFDITVTKVGN